MPRHQEEQRRLAPPLRDHLLDRGDVADRLRHLLAGEPEQAVVHPDLRERPPDGLRLRPLVLVVREDEVEPAAVDPELRPERLLGHRRALDVPARPARAPRRLPRGVLALLRRLPEREVARVLLQRARLLVLDLVGPLARERAVAREAARRGSRRRRRPRRRGRHATSSSISATISGIVSVASGCSSGISSPNEPCPRGTTRVASRARAALAPGRRLVDLVVHVGDVVDVGDARSRARAASCAARRR